MKKIIEKKLIEKGKLHEEYQTGKWKQSKSI